MKILLLLGIITGLVIPVRTINGVIWSKREEKFVPIFSIPAFADAKQELVAQSRKLETHDFQGQIIKFTYFQEDNVVEFYAENTKITGFAGEIWNILSASLNFTLDITRCEDPTLGRRLIYNQTVQYSGLLGTIQRNETNVIPKVEMFSTRRDAAQLTYPLWKTKYRFYTRRVMSHSTTWMVKLFSRKLWIGIIIMYILLTACGFAFEFLVSKIKRVVRKANWRDHLFYVFGVICRQCHTPPTLHGRSRMLMFWLDIFSYVISTSYCALLLVYMTQKIHTPPFDDMDSLLDETSYDIVMLSGSLPHLALQANNVHFRRSAKLDRNVIVPTVEDLYTHGCSTKKKHAAFMAEDMKMAKGLYICRLNPTGIPYFAVYIASGISRDFLYKRTIDIGILRLRETGHLKFLKQRWINMKNIEAEHQTLQEAIDIEQIILILLAYCNGVLISVVILIFEIITYGWKKK